MCLCKLKNNNQIKVSNLKGNDLDRPLLTISENYFINHMNKFCFSNTWNDN